MKSRIGLLVFAMAFVWCGSASAQFGGWKSLAKKAAGKAEESKKESPPPESKPAEQPNTETTNGPSSSTNTPPASNSAGAGGQAAAGTASSQAPGGQPQLVSVPIEFVPGEKTVFYDDFSDMPPGEPPPHWQVRGGTVELRMGGSIRELDVPYSASLTSPDVSLPPDFTFESEMVLRHDFHWRIGSKDNDDVFSIFGGPDAGSLQVNGPGGKLGDGKIEADFSQPVKIALWVQQGRVRAYFNGKRLVDANQVKFGALNHLRFTQDNEGSESKFIGIRDVRLAESAPDPGAVLSATGRFVTHGIYFDTDSDILKPESAPVIKEISNALYKNPSMKLEIDGYTDSTGDAAHNLDLSKRRAAAVAKVLVDQFGIDQSRLASNGFGASKPVASNDTPDGRAQNRRVEFVKE